MNDSNLLVSSPTLTYRKRSTSLFWRIKAWMRRVRSPHPSSIDAKTELSYLHELFASYSKHSFTRLGENAENYTEEPDDAKKAHRAMLKEPFVKSSFWTKVWSVAGQDANFLPADKTSAMDKKAAAYTKYVFDTLEGKTRCVVENILVGALIDGWSVNEKVFGHERNSNEWQGKWRLAQFKPKDVRLTDPIIDEFKNLIGLYGGGPNAGQIFHPKDFVTFTYQSLFGSLTGISDFRAIFRAVTIKETAVKLRIIYLDRYVGPYLIGKYSAEQARSKMIDRLREARAEGVIAISTEDEVTAINLAMSGTADFKSAIDDLNQEILIGIRGSHLDMQEGQNPGARGDTEVQRSMSEICEWWMSTAVTDTITQHIIPDIVRPNFGPRCGLPIMKLGAINPKDILNELSIDDKLLDMNVPLSKTEIYERAQRTPPKSQEDALFKPAVAYGGFQQQGPQGQGEDSKPTKTEDGKPEPAGPPSDDLQGASRSLLQTVGGLQAIKDMQIAYYAGAIPQDAAVAAMEIIFGLSTAEANALFPEKQAVDLSDTDNSPTNGKPPTPPNGANVRTDEPPKPPAPPAQFDAKVIDKPPDDIAPDVGGAKRIEDEVIPAAMRIALPQLSNMVAKVLSDYKPGQPLNVDSAFAASDIDDVANLIKVFSIRAKDIAREYVEGITPDGISTAQFAPLIQVGDWYQLAVTTLRSILDAVLSAIDRRLATGQDFSGGPQEIEDILIDSGIHPKNPQYAEMVFRTNTMRAYNEGVEEQKQSPEIAEEFPVWQYKGILDGRQGKDHEIRFDRYYPANVKFEDVRGDRPFNCRCVPVLIHKSEWARLQSQGATISTI